MKPLYVFRPDIGEKRVAEFCSDTAWAQCAAMYEAKGFVCSVSGIGAPAKRRSVKAYQEQLSQQGRAA